MPAATRFLNVDLAVYAPHPLSSLARAMESCGAFTLHSGRRREGGYRAAFEINRPVRSASAVIKEFARIIQRLPPLARQRFDRAALRVFSIGIQTEAQPAAFDLPVDSAALAIVLRLRARISITVYAPDPGPELSRLRYSRKAASTTRRIAARRPR